MRLGFCRIRHALGGRRFTYLPIVSAPARVATVAPDLHAFEHHWQDEALTLARESAEHAETLNQISGRTGEPWHRTESGGFLRNVVYGFNDGLTANFGLVAGVIGATVTTQHHTVILAGVAGMIADALSMCSSGYLAAKSEHEVYAHQIAMERVEIALMADLGRDEIALSYEAQLLDAE